jgi:hypothetical protein
MLDGVRGSTAGVTDRAAAFAYIAAVRRLRGASSPQAATEPAPAAPIAKPKSRTLRIESAAG